MKYQYIGANPVCLYSHEVEDFKIINHGEIVELDDPLGSEFVLVTPKPAQTEIKKPSKKKPEVSMKAKKKSPPKSEE